MRSWYAARALLANPRCRGQPLSTVLQQPATRGRAVRSDADPCAPGRGPEKSASRRIFPERESACSHLLRDAAGTALGGGSLLRGGRSAEREQRRRVAGEDLL